MKSPLIKPKVGGKYQIVSSTNAVDKVFVGKDFTVTDLVDDGLIGTVDGGQLLKLSLAAVLIPAKEPLCRCYLYFFPHKRSTRCRPHLS